MATRALKPGRARLAATTRCRPTPKTTGPARCSRSPPAGRLGDPVIDVAAQQGFGDRLITRPSFSAQAGIVGVIGPNGAGKTTLFRMVTGQDAPDSGSITIGDTVEMAYVDQSRDTLNDENSVYDEITDGVEHMKVGTRELHGRAYVASFNFKGSDQQQRVGDLSGGDALGSNSQGAKRGGNGSCSTRHHDPTGTRSCARRCLESFPDRRLSARTMVSRPDRHPCPESKHSREMFEGTSPNTRSAAPGDGGRRPTSPSLTDKAGETMRILESLSWSVRAAIGGMMRLGANNDGWPSRAASWPASGRGSDAATSGARESGAVPILARSMTRLTRAAAASRRRCRLCRARERRNRAADPRREAVRSAEGDGT